MLCKSCAFYKLIPEKDIRDYSTNCDLIKEETDTVQMNIPITNCVPHWQAGCYAEAGSIWFPPNFGCIHWKEKSDALLL